MATDHNLLSNSISPLLVEKDKKPTADSSCSTTRSQNGSLVSSFSIFDDGILQPGSKPLRINNYNNNSKKKHARSKSLSNIANGENYTPGEIRRIKERLLRTNSHVNPSTLKSFTKHQKITLALLALVDFFCFCSMSIMAPFFPTEAEEKGLSESMTGFVFSFYALVMFLTSPIFGKILPKFGAKLVFLIGMLVAGVCNLLFGMLEYVTNYTTFTVLCLTIRGLEALGSSAFSTASYVFIINTFPENIGSVIGILETFVGLGMSIGPVLGGFLYTIGGFDLPFYVLGVALITMVPLNLWLLPSIAEDFDRVSSGNTSVWKLIKIPAVLVTGLMVVIASSVWSFLDPTLEPHLRQFNLTPEKIGLIFLLFSALYGLSSPIWGWLADRINNHWSMMVTGLFMTSGGLLFLGPSPFITFIESSLLMNLLALSLLGISVALALMPTFQGVLKSAVNGGCGSSLATYSMVAGIWSSMYSLGEVIGPSLGGLLLQYYGFPISSTVMAGCAFLMALIALIFFLLQSFVEKDQFAGDIESGISVSWSSTTSSSGDMISDEMTPLIGSNTGSGYKSYTKEKIQYYEQSRKHDNELGNVDYNQITDIRGTISVTGKGACEV